MPTRLRGEISANAEERTALAARFDLPAIESLCAEVGLSPEGDGVRATGRLAARFLQECAVSGDPFENRVEEDISLLFVPAAEPAASGPDEEIELEAGELDEIPFEGLFFDLGEAVAQSFALALDPYAQGPDADSVRQRAGIGSNDAPSGPLAEALASLGRKNDH